MITEKCHTNSGCKEYYKWKETDDHSLTPLFLSRSFPPSVWMIASKSLISLSRLDICSCIPRSSSICSLKTSGTISSNQRIWNRTWCNLARHRTDNPIHTYLWCFQALLWPLGHVFQQLFERTQLGVSLSEHEQQLWWQHLVLFLVFVPFAQEPKPKTLKRIHKQKLLLFHTSWGSLKRSSLSWFYDHLQHQ